MMEKCPRCGEESLSTEVNTVHKIKLHPHRNKLVAGDNRKESCHVCRWHSTGTWNGKEWQWKTARPLTPKEQTTLDVTLKKYEKKRRTAQYQERIRRRKLDRGVV